MKQILHRLSMITVVLFLLTVAPSSLFGQEDADDDWSVKRVKGTLEKEISKKGDIYHYGDVKTGDPLPNGFPRPTPPGVFELKKYPKVRKASVYMKSAERSTEYKAFTRLLKHIKTKKYSMTAPVEMEYRNLDPEKLKKANRIEMSFLYRNPDRGESGPAGNVKVVDGKPVTVLSTGVVSKKPSVKLVERITPTLMKWIKSSEWEATGDPRTYAYNNPMEEKPWWEVQIPVARKTKEDSGNDGAPEKDRDGESEEGSS